MSKAPVVYAVYKGDEFITVGTALECARELGVKEETIRYKSMPSYKRRIAKNSTGGAQAMVVFRLEEDDED